MNIGTIYAADLYCGAGGASAGLHAAARELGAQLNLVAVNHWDVAIRTHSTNFPEAKHYQTEVERVDPLEAIPGCRLHMLTAGPKCVHFSKSRGGMPVSEQQRADAWEVIVWARKLHIERILVENVEEFLTWGPLRQRRFSYAVHARSGRLFYGEGGRVLGKEDDGAPLFDPKTGEPLMEPDPDRKEMYFRQWVRMLRDMGYTVEWRVLNCADYGDATTRRRLFIQARLSGPITWPKPTHHSPQVRAAYPKAKSWVPARDIIRWDVPGKSIFGRTKPLRDTTHRRIFYGLDSICGLRLAYWDTPDVPLFKAETFDLVKPFIVILKGTSERQLKNSLQTVDEPLASIHGCGHFGLVVPELTPFVIGQQSCSAPRSVNDPIPTVATSGAISLVMPTLTPLLVGVGGPRGQQSARSVDNPLGTLLGQNHTGLVVPKLSPYLIRYNGGEGGTRRVQDVDTPLSTLDTSNRIGMVQPTLEPFLISYYGNGGAHSIDEPLDTITTRDRFALIEPLLDKGDQVAVLDLPFRMLMPEELAAAHSFGKSYFFAGGREDRVKQVGNSWPCETSKALWLNMLSDGGAA